MAVNLQIENLEGIKVLLVGFIGRLFQVPLSSVLASISKLIIRYGIIGVFMILLV